MMSPAVAISERLLVVGLDLASVDRVVSQRVDGTALLSSANFRNAVKVVPDPQYMFAYIDLAALYSRLDATLRPILQMSAAFLPGVSKRVDPNKLPPAEVITKHLTPVVASSSYIDGGYRSESVGPITLTQTLGLAAAGYVGAMFFQKHSQMPATLKVAPSTSATASPSPTIAIPIPTP